MRLHATRSERSLEQLSRARFRPAAAAGAVRRGAARRTAAAAAADATPRARVPEPFPLAMCTQLVVGETRTRKNKNVNG